MSGLRRQRKILQYEEFLNERLKPDLNSILEERDKVYSDIAEYLALKNCIASIESAGLTAGQPLKSKVDLGCNFYVNARVDDPSRLFVDVGLGFFAELTFAEAKTFIGKKVEILENRAKRLSQDACKVKANIKLTLEGLRELQNLANEDLLQRKKINRDPSGF